MKARLVLLATVATLVALGGVSIHPAAGQSTTSFAAGSERTLLIEGISDQGIEVASWSWGLAGRKAVGGKVNVQDISFTTRVSAASPRLIGAVASGQHIKDATLTVRKAGESQQDVLVIRMKDVLVSSYSTGLGAAAAADAHAPTETFTLSFSTLQIHYTSQNPDGSAGETASAEVHTKTDD